MKRAKRGNVVYTKIAGEYSAYICPHCSIKFIGAGITRNVTRFLCAECKNEIIVEHHIKRREP